MMIAIRPMRPGDLADVSSLAAALVRLHHAWDPKRFMLIEPLEQGYHRFFAGQLTEPNVVLLVATKDEQIVGYLYGSIEARNWNSLLDRCGAVHDLYVDEGARNQGVASKLIAQALRQLKVLGAPRVVLMSAQANPGGQRLFAKLGFRSTMIEMTLEL